MLRNCKEKKLLNLICFVFVSDSMAIQSEDDRELILSEIYALQNTADNDLEVSILGRSLKKILWLNIKFF